MPSLWRIWWRTLRRFRKLKKYRKRSSQAYRLQAKDILIYSLKHTTITTVAQRDLGLAQRMANHSNQSTTEIYNRGKQSSQAIPREKLKDFK